MTDSKALDIDSDLQKNIEHKRNTRAETEEHEHERDRMERRREPHDRQCNSDSAQEMQHLASGHGVGLPVGARVARVPPEPQMVHDVGAEPVEHPHLAKGDHAADGTLRRAVVFGREKRRKERVDRRREEHHHRERKGNVDPVRALRRELTELAARVGVVLWRPCVEQQRDRVREHFDYWHGKESQKHRVRQNHSDGLVRVRVF
eukprot:Amastigsp_a175683_243.p3 type:complete len:204 gc:universal Amastigsp_a175683_243:1353-1964(+)